MKQISIEAFKNALEANNGDASVDFINVCTTSEYNEKHIKGVRSAPLDTLPSRLNEFKNKKMIYIHCRGGKRGTQAMEILTDLGITAELINMEGGILAWEEAGFPIEL